MKSNTRMTQDKLPKALTPEGWDGIRRAPLISAHGP